MGCRKDDLIWACGILAMVILAGAAWRAAGRVASHRPVALAVSYGLGADLARRFLQIAFLAGAPRPFTGAARLLYHVDFTLMVGWPCALTLLTAAVFRPRSALATGVPLGTWFGLLAAHALVYPLGERQTQRVFFLVELLMLASAALTVAGTWSRRWRSPHGAVLFLLGTELVVVLLGPFVGNVFRDWRIAVVLYGSAFLALSIWYALLPANRPAPG